MTSFIQKLRELSEEATKSPWKTYAPDAWTDGLSYIRPADEDGMEIAHHGDAGRSRVENEANAALIVYLVNNAEAIADVVEEARFILDRLNTFACGDTMTEEGMRDYAGHVSPSAARLDAGLRKLEASK